MDIFEVKATDSTPYMKFDNQLGVLEISGRSMPEDVVMVYEPAICWLRAYAQNPLESTVMIINLKYFNSASAKVILSLLHALEPISKRAKSIEIHWVYSASDEESFESGEDYASMVNIPFKFVKND